MKQIQTMQRPANLLPISIFHILCKITVSISSNSVCEDQLQLKADIVAHINKETSNPIIFVNNAESNTEFRCGNQKNFTVLFDANDFNFWNKTKKQLCVICNETIISLQNNHTLTPTCSRDNSKDSFVCDIGQLHVAKNGNSNVSACNKKLYHDQPIHEIEYYNPGHENWTRCNTKDSNARKPSFFECNTSQMKVDDELLILRLVERYMRKSSTGLSFQKKPDCIKEAYFSIKSDLYDQRNDHIYIIIIGTLAAFFCLIIIFVVLIYLYKKRKYTTLSKEKLHEEDEINNGTYVNEKKAKFDRQCSVRQEADQKAVTENISPEMRQTIITECLLEGDLSRQNPMLPLTTQKNTLHYDRKYDRTKDSFKISYVLGEGMFGTVYLGSAPDIYGPQETKVAIKQVKNMLDDEQINAIVGEMKILSNLKMHPNLVNLLGACRSELHLNEMYLLLEYCPFGDLKQFLVNNKKQFENCLNNVPGHLESMFNSQLLLEWSYSIAKGLQYLTKAKIMHGDLAARNILIGENYVAKISDFGLSKNMYYGKGRMRYNTLRQCKDFLSF